MLGHKAFESWGRYPNRPPARVTPVFWRNGLDSDVFDTGPVLPYGLGRSYGDCCLNGGGTILDTSPLSRFVAFDPSSGSIRCESGVTLGEILDLCVPQGWFLPVVPGTKHVTVGGAIANDVHGKNHHRCGTFGRHVTRFELLRSSGEKLLCSAEQNHQMFVATIGGLGLTGLILWAELQLKRITGPGIDAEYLRFSHLDEFLELSAASNATHEYTVAWVDSLASGRNVGRGIFIRGNHTDSSTRIKRPQGRISVPLDAPSWLLNRWSVRAFNTLFYRKRSTRISGTLTHYEPFFFPLDAIDGWNRMYGKRGFLQYQCVVPKSRASDTVRKILAMAAQSGRVSFLTVLKEFGDMPSPGLLSFPRSGITLTLDFPYHPEVMDLMDAMDGLVSLAGGAVYPAKDARMSSETFRSFFPRWKDFQSFVDPRFSSSLWRRVSSSLEQVET